MKEIIGAFPVITPSNFEDKNDSIELVTALKQIDFLQNHLDDYATNFIKSFHKTANEVMEYIPESDIENWKILSKQLGIFYPQKYIWGTGKSVSGMEDMHISEILRSISGDSKAYFINFDKKEVNLFWDDTTKLLMNPHHYKSKIIYDTINSEIDKTNNKVIVDCYFSYTSGTEVPAPGAVRIGTGSGSYWNRTEMSTFTKSVYLSHEFCLETNKYIKFKMTGL